MVERRDARIAELEAAREQGAEPAAWAISNHAKRTSPIGAIYSRKSAAEAHIKGYEEQGDHSLHVIPLYTQPQSAGVPEGWKLVPEEPTPEMREAFHRAHGRYENGYGEAPDSHWRAMLRLAPQPPREQEPQR